jgi:predicted DNA-binding transcriptional regulator AlpA
VTHTTDTPWNAVPPTGPMLRPSEAAAYLGFKSRQQLYEMVRCGEVPAPIRLRKVGNASGIPRPWLDAIIAARVAESVAA